MLVLLRDRGAFPTFQGDKPLAQHQAHVSKCIAHVAVITIRIRHRHHGFELEAHQAADHSLATWVRLEPDLVSGEKIGRKHAWCEGLANTVRDVRDQGAGYGTIATKLGITNGKVRRILNASTAPVA